MAAINAGPEIDRLIQLLARLPGLGPRSARRAALFLIKKREQIMAPLTAAMQTAFEKVEVCKLCGNIDTRNPCVICTDARRDPAIIVVVADVADVWALERAHALSTRVELRLESRDARPQSLGLLMLLLQLRVALRDHGGERAHLLLELSHAPGALRECLLLMVCELIAARELARQPRELSGAVLGLVMQLGNRVLRDLP